MNYKKWEKLARKGGNPSIFLAKLMEEVGEVANAYMEKSTDDLVEEIQHVQFIAQCFEDSLVRR